jgi:hypothetical protein
LTTPGVSPFAAELLANAVLVLHVCIAAFVVVGLLLIVIGNIARWRWVNNLRFRLAHVLAIVVVVAEVWLGIACPLTLLEMSLRARAGAATYGGGFIEHWLSRLLYYEAPSWVFVVAYSVVGLLVIVSWWYFPPQPRRHTGRRRRLIFRRH